jgi:D-glycero-D-manno-heptose 1,7-bisphosphate phosphatase
MKPAAIFFDRDNTLIVNNGYLGDPNGVVLVEGAAEAVAMARDLGYLVVTASNQSGVARGMFTEDDVRAVDARMDELLRQANAKAIIDLHEFCPFHPEAKADKYRMDSDLRKPKPGMLLRAARQLDLDLGRCWMIGDSPRDIEAGKAAGCRTIMVKSAGMTRSPAADEPMSLRPDAIVETLILAMRFVRAHK